MREKWKSAIWIETYGKFVPMFAGFDIWLIIEKWIEKMAIKINLYSLYTGTKESNQ